MSFKDIHIPLSIKTTTSNPVYSFFNPVLAQSATYDVAVGFFTSGWIRDAAEGIANFAINGGVARWIVSPVLNSDDYISISSYDDNNLDCRKIIKVSFEELYKALQSDVRRVLSWMIRDSILEIRVGVPVNMLTGMLHAKMGILSDFEGNLIGFSGSYNLTANAKTNWEKIDIFCGWRSEESRSRIDDMVSDFNCMWDNKDQNLKIFKPLDSELRPFLKETEHSDRPYPIKEKTKHFSPPAQYLVNGSLRDYQNSAIESWIKNNGSGILAMATGTGKTVTALSLMSRLANRIISEKKVHIFVVTVPFQHLADQWADESKKFGFNPLVCYGGHDKWGAILSRNISELRANLRKIVFLVVVNNTFVKDMFQSYLHDFYKNMTLVSDEVHTMGASQYRNRLNNAIKFRLGLSATPVRHADLDGTQAIQNFYGETVFELNIEDAINLGCLCKYKYIPILCSLNEEEMESYKELTRQIVLQTAISNNNEDNDKLRMLLIKRSRLISNIESKFTALRKLVSENRDSRYNLVYCGDASDDDGRQVDKIISMLGCEFQIKARKFTAEETPQERHAILKLFSDGDIQTLVAIRCLDEGVDVPRTENAFILASSSNPRQYIQRRGRVLRIAEGKKYATIYDFIAIPSLSKMNNDDMKVEKSLLKKEFSRINEFAKMSLNSGEALKILRQVKVQYNLVEC